MPLSKTITDKNCDVFSGEGALDHLDALTEKHKNILLFNDRNGFVPCGAAAYFDRLERKHPHLRLRKIPYAGKALPIDDIETLYQKIRRDEREPVDLVIAVGGGTVIDLAKVIAIAYSNDCAKAEEVLDDKSLENRLPLIFVPTTAGTGSETTSFAVVYRDKVKLSVDRKSVLPGHIILAPRLLLSLPEPILNSTVLDALAQATESAWAVGSTGESKSYSAKAIPLILDNLVCLCDMDEPVAEPKRVLDRLEALQLASYWAGKAINVSKTTLPHSISYPITSHFGVSHGTAVFLTIAEVAVLNFHTTEETRQEKISLEKIKESFSLLFGLYRVGSIEELAAKMRKVMETLKIKARLSDYGIGQKIFLFWRPMH